MNNQSETIRKFVTYINNKDHLGGFWLPNIQRPFVWSEEQMERLYDSILREYPIGSLLVWKTQSEIKHRRFIDNWTDSLILADYYVPENGHTKMLVLDGQQRIQSLFIGLLGSYNGKELYLNILSGEPKDPEDIRFEFKFLRKKPSFPWVKFKDLVFTDKKPRQMINDLQVISDRSYKDKEEEKVYENVEQIRNVFCTQENLLYQVIDSLDRPETYTENDVVEIFIRANSGGTKLNKSDLMFSLLISSWDEVEENMSELLWDINKTGYEFTRDFVLKTCLVLLDKGARYDIKKFRAQGTRETIRDNWEEIVKSIKTVTDYIYGSTFLKTDKTIPSYLSLIPLVYFRFKHRKKWNQHLPDYHNYLLRTSLTGVFGGTPDNLIDHLIKRINEDNDFILREVYGVIREDNRGLEMSKETVLGLNYWKKEIHLFFNLWYGFNYQPALQDNKPQLDHIFPQSELKKIKIPNPDTGRINVMKYGWKDRDQIANMMLLTAVENGATGKAAIVPEAFFSSKDSAYLTLHLIPQDPTLWKVDKFEEFIEARKKLIVEKFEYILQKEK